MENENTTPMPSALLQELLTRPQVLEALGKIKESLPADGAPPATPQATACADGLSALLASPALKERLPQMMSLLAPMLSGAGNATPPIPNPTESIVAPPLSPAHSPSAHEKDTAHAREALLSALKPFLSPARQHTVDMLLQLSHLGDVLRQLH